MSIFLATHTNKLDKKGRVSVPAAFRCVLAAEAFQGIVAFRSLEAPAIEGFGMSRMVRLSQQVDTLDPFSQEQEDLTAGIFADAQPLAFDGEGRILLTETLIAFARLEDSVSFVGRGSTFQLWNPELFQNYQESARQRLKVHRPSLTPLSPPPREEN